MSTSERKYRFLLVNSKGSLSAMSNIYTDSEHTPNLNKNLARWISYGFPGCSGEDKGAGIILTNDTIEIESITD